MPTPTTEETYVSSVFIAAGYDTVWERITDPTNFPELYPHWTTTVGTTNEGLYHGVGPDGDEFLIKPRLEEEHGVIDFEIGAGGAIERSRSRLFDIDEHSCLLVHVAVRWRDIDDHDWEEHKRGTDDDLTRMKRLIEANKSN